MDLATGKAVTVTIYFTTKKPVCILWSLNRVRSRYLKLDHGVLAEVA